MGKITCCQNCNKRKLGCHSNCKAYLMQKAQCDKEKEELTKDNKITHDINEIHHKRYETRKRHKKS